MPDVCPSQGWWRYGVLLFDSFLLFGSLFCIDMPTVLQHELITNQYVPSKNNTTNSTSSDDRNHTDCNVCLGLGEVRYNLLHSSLRWTSAVLCLPIGYVIDRLGNSCSALLLTVLTCLGSVLFALGAVPHAPTTTPLFLLMVAGRVFLAFGESPLRIVQDRVIAHWFPDDSYVPLAIVLLGRRSGTLLNFLVTANIAEFLGFGVAVWFGVILTGFGVVCASGLSLLHFLGSKAQDQTTYEYMTSKHVSGKDLQVIPRRFWLHVAMVSAFYGGYFSFVANVTNYLQLRHGYTMVDASYITGTVQIAPVLAPLVAVVMKVIDCNGLVGTCSIAFMIPAYLLLGFCPSVHPVILTAPIGLINCIVALILWQVAVVLSPANCFGTVAGIVYLVRNCTIAISMFCIGYVLEDYTGYADTTREIQRYENFYLTLVAITCVAVVCGVVLNVLDIRGNCVINQRIGKWKKQHEETFALISNEHKLDDYTSTDRQSLASQ